MRRLRRGLDVCFLPLSYFQLICVTMLICKQRREKKQMKRWNANPAAVPAARDTNAIREKDLNEVNVSRRGKREGNAENIGIKRTGVTPRQTQRMMNMRNRKCWSRVPL